MRFDPVIWAAVFVASAVVIRTALWILERRREPEHDFTITVCATGALPEVSNHVEYSSAASDTVVILTPVAPGSVQLSLPISAKSVADAMDKGLGRMRPLMRHLDLNTADVSVTVESRRPTR